MRLQVSASRAALTDYLLLPLLNLSSRSLVASHTLTFKYDLLLF